VSQMTSALLLAMVRLPISSSPYTSRRGYIQGGGVAIILVVVFLIWPLNIIFNLCCIEREIDMT